MARADRPGLTPAPADGPPGTEPARRAVEALWRIESARIVGALTRYTGDFDLAEDVAHHRGADRSGVAHLGPRERRREDPPPARPARRR
ncbi:hypothetical protein ABZ885_36415, partial [Kitasatospora sp. NPDC047058]